MPNSPQPVRATRLARTVAGLVVLLVVLGVVYLVTTRHAPLHQEPTACAVSAGKGKQEIGLTISQAAIASTIAGVAAGRDLPVRAVTIAYATALQESKLTDLSYGDRDSVGVFQQRPSEGWGTAKQIEDPVYASARFFAALAAVRGYAHLPVYQAAQDVQHSADGSAYGQYATIGAQLANAFYGTTPHALWCYYNGKAPKPRLTAAYGALTSTFGHMTTTRVADPALAIRVRRASEGWTIAGWLITHAQSYGITSVRYRGYQWVRGRAAGKWLPGRGKPATQADPNAVVFG